MIVEVLGAGAPAGVNVCRALRMAGHEIIATDANSEHLVLCRPYADKLNSPWPTRTADVTWAQPDTLVRWLSQWRMDFNVLLPMREVIETCQDKCATAQLWAAAGLRSAPVGIGREIPDWLNLAADEFGTLFWLRARNGAGARAATKVEDLRTGYHWIRYWQTRGEDIEWVAEEYLPGKDYCWTSLWNDGELVAAFTRCRDEWLYPQNSPSGITGTPTIATIVHDPVVKAIAKEALLTIDSVPHGAYAVDLREDSLRVPRPTEINAGRWPTTSPLYADLGPNMPDMAVRIAAGEEIPRLGEDIYPEGVRLHRHIDCGHQFTGPLGGGLQQVEGELRPTVA